MYASLEKAYTIHSRDLTYSSLVEPVFDRYRSELSFQDIVRRVGFQQ